MDDQRPVTKQDIRDLKDDLRQEFGAKIGSVRAWGIAALLGGQAVAALLAALVAPDKTQEVALAVARLLTPVL